MKYRLLGKSGLRVSEASLGTMTFGDEWGWGSSQDEARKVYETYREAGGNFIDTANFYTGGTSEKFVGEFIKGHRDSVVLATKYSNAAPGNDPNAAGNQRKNMMQAVEASLKRLQTVDEAVPAPFPPALFMSGSAPEARLTSPTSSYPRCGTNSVGTWRSPRTNPK